MDLPHATPSQEALLALRADMLTVESRRDVVTGISEKIRNFDATNQEIIEWYYSLDPLFEQRSQEGLLFEINPHERSRFMSIIGHDVQMMETAAKGGATLACRMFNISEKEMTPEDSKAFMLSHAEELCLEINDKMGTYEAIIVLQHLLEHDSKYVIGEDICQQMIIAADMLMMYQEQVAPYKFDAGKEVMAENIPEQSMDNAYPNATISAAMLYDVVAGLPDHFPYAVNDEMKSLSVVASQRLSALLMQESFRLCDFFVSNPDLVAGMSVDEITRLQQVYMHSSGFIPKLIRSLVVANPEGVPVEKLTIFAPLMLLDSIESIYLGRNDDKSGHLFGSSLPKSTLKGDLYEAIWQLDFMMMKLIHGKVVPAYWPALNFQDKPKVGFPKMGRGYDARIVGKNGYVRLVQLKSSLSAADRKAEPHPNIDTIAESNFMDFEPRRLTVKLAKYREVLSSFVGVGSDGIVDKYALPTVKKAFALAEVGREEHIFGASLVRYALNHLGFVPTPTPEPKPKLEPEPFRPRNRAERRELDKKFRRAASRQ